MSFGISDWNVCKNCWNRSSSTKYAQPLLRSGSSACLETFSRFSRKFASIPINKVYNHLQQIRSESEGIKCWVYLWLSGASFQSEGRFFPGWGQAGQRTAQSPGSLTLLPGGWPPRPIRFNSFKCRHCRIIVKNAGYRYYTWQVSIIIVAVIMPHTGVFNVPVLSVLRDKLV